MNSANLLKGLFKKINSENSFVGGEGGGHTHLTPHLALVVAILYMMVADGEISEQESSQLQSVIGKNENVLRRALLYVETTKIEQFLKDVPAVLDSQDSLCILMNVCDSIMADGQLAALEMTLFEQLSNALGFSKKSFRPYFKTISIKNKKSVLGSFENFVKSDQLTTQMALAASLLYMMSADGSMSEEKISRLNLVIGRSEALLQAALQYVRKNKFQKFIKEAAALLNPAQQLCVLMNVCDSMMSDGTVGNTERELFKRMLAAFNFSEEKFKPYFDIFARKNEKPLEKDNEEIQGQVIPARFKKKEQEGVIFERKLSRPNKNSLAPGEVESAGLEDNAIGEPAERSEDGIIINRQMHDNINKMSESMVGMNGIQDLNENGNSNLSSAEISIREFHDKNSISDNAPLTDSIHYLESNAAHGAKEEKANFDKKGRRRTTAANQKQKHKKHSGHAKMRAIKDRLHSIQGKSLIPANQSPSDRRVIEDNEFDFDGSPLEVRMVVVQIRTDEINETLDMLDDVSDAHFHKRGAILNTITFSPAPTTLAYINIYSESLSPTLLSNPITALQNEELPMTTNNPVLENTTSTTSTASTASIQALKVKIATLFSALLIAHGFSSFGESSAQKDLIQNGNLAANANVSLQALAVQQTIYKLAADDLESSLEKKDSLSSEQQEAVKIKLSAYLLKIADQESSPVTQDGKKELSAARKHHQELVSKESSMLEWFVLSKVILLFGIGLTLCSFYFKSRAIFYGASLTAVGGIFLTLNGYFLFLQLG